MWLLKFKMTLLLWGQFDLHFMFSWASLVAQLVKDHLQCRRPGFKPWVRKIPWIRKWQPTPVFLPGESHEQRSLAGCSPWGHKELDMTKHTHTHTHTLNLLPVSDSVWPHRWQPTRLPRPWDSPGKNTRVGCHFLLQCMKVKRESEVAQSRPTLSDPMDCSLPGSSVHGIFQARVLEWGAIAFSFSSYICIQTLENSNSVDLHSYLSKY